MSTAAASVVVLASAPVLALLGAFLRAVVLFWPTMLLLGAVHSHLDWVPPLGAAATFLVVALISLLVPTGDTSSD
jgi:hypothetical protein